jgi:methylated-DNA-[protein]-cysteine S-methyltransferase
MTQYTTIDSPLGKILLTSEGGLLTGLYFIGQKYQPEVPGDWAAATALALFRHAADELDEYFDGARSRFDVPLAAHGTQFQQRVWRALQTVEAGTTLSYSALAETIGAARSVRAVAAAVGRNPISILIPCHRVIGADGSLTGYAGGLERKAQLLALEGCAAAAARRAA